MTHVKVTYRKNLPEMQALMLSAQMRKPAVAAVNDIVQALSATVHRGSGNGGADGHLADSYKVNANSEPVSLRGTPRVGAEIYSEHPGAAPDEFGGKNQPAKHWLSNVAAAWHVPRKGIKE